MTRSQLNRLRQELFDMLPELSVQPADLSDGSDPAGNSGIAKPKDNPRSNA